MSSTEIQPQSEANQVAEAEQKTITLSDGRKATFIEGMGYHSVQANEIATTPASIPLALASLLTLIDGQPVPYEDLLQMKLSDVMKIQTAVMGDLGK